MRLYGVCQTYWKLGPYVAKDAESYQYKAFMAILAFAGLAYGPL